MNLMIPFYNRFHGHSSLRYVYKNGRVIRSRSATIRVIANPHRKHSRVAVIISKKVLKSAVRRNRIRRRIYECIRLKLPHLNGVYDIAVIVLSSELINVPPQELSEQFDQLFDQAGIKE